MEIRAGNFDNPGVKALLEYHLRGMHANSPPGHVFALDWSGLQKPEISFYAGWSDGVPVVIGALKDLGDGSGEVKSMRAAEGHSGKGHGETMLLHIIEQARARGFRRLSLETGSGPAFDPAVSLYRKHGFVEGGEFGGYVKSDFNRLFHLAL
jgi:putative acetyltransferase